MIELTEEEISQAYRDMANTNAGRIILDDLRESFYDIPCFNPSEDSPNRTIHRDGCRWVVGYILEQVSSKDQEPNPDNPQRGNYL